jgi:hypothetical protein
LLLLTAGCASHNPHCHGGTFVCECRAADKAEATTAPYKATYVLYQWRNPPAGEPAPRTWIGEHEVAELYIRGLDAGDAIGFEKGDKDQLFAVCGGEKILLEPGRYCWHITQETQPSGFRQVVHEMCETTRDLVTTVLALPLGIVLLVLLVPLFILLLPFILGLIIGMAFL